MNSHPARTIGLTCLALLSAALTACLSFPSSRPDEMNAPAAPRRIAQVGFGDDANYVQCQPAACPTRTPKTLDIPEPRPIQGIPHPEPANPDPIPPDGATVPTANATRSWSVPFAFGSAQIGPVGQGILLQVIAELPNASPIHLSGRTDNSGPLAANDALAAARAKAVRDYLAKARPDLSEAMDIDAQGDCCFIAPNDTPASRARNRRVEITVLSRLRRPEPEAAPWPLAPLSPASTRRPPADSTRSDPPATRPFDAHLIRRSL
ncbi:OmpA family protein [Dechloromonas agitata]|uniref:OmpA family protein n=1 Tax=Dechloromonas agitata TaxID=73030 RepID=UPI00237E868A|nr:OmpA family protein [Dechloromonas agitata]MDE1543966.1 OmpA family protein [Dechloromonas agitata]